MMVRWRKRALPGSSSRRERVPGEGNPGWSPSTRRSPAPEWPSSASSSPVRPPESDGPTRLPSASRRSAPPRRGWRSGSRSRPGGSPSAAAPSAAACAPSLPPRDCTSPRWSWSATRCTRPAVPSASAPSTSASSTSLPLRLRSTRCLRQPRGARAGDRRHPRSRHPAFRRRRSLAAQERGRGGGHRRPVGEAAPSLLIVGSEVVQATGPVWKMGHAISVRQAPRRPCRAARPDSARGPDRPRRGRGPTHRSPTPRKRRRCRRGSRRAQSSPVRRRAASAPPRGRPALGPA